MDGDDVLYICMSHSVAMRLILNPYVDETNHIRDMVQYGACFDKDSALNRRELQYCTPAMQSIPEF